MATERDYDVDPDRYRMGMRVTADFSAPEADLYQLISQRLRAEGADSVLDVGCGEGVLAAVAGPSLQVIGVDAARSMLQAASRVCAVARADATALPITDGAVDAVVAVNVFDHLAEPLVGLREARRVLRRGGMFIAGTISRADSPELAPVWQPTPTPFDAEDAPDLVAAVFGGVRVLRWDAPLITLPDHQAIRDYLCARFVRAEQASRLAARLQPPLRVTKRGALVIAHST